MKTICKSTMKYVFVGLLALSFIIPIGMLQEAQASGWETTIGGEDDDEGYSVQQTTDGGYIIVGDTILIRSANGNGQTSDIYLIKAGSYGNRRWQKIFGGGGDDYGRYVQQTFDGGYIIAGSTNSYGAGNYDVYLVKTDAYGNMEWQRMFGGRGRDEGYSVQQTTDGGYIIAGTRDGDVYLIKTDALGNKKWEKTYGDKSTDEGYFVQQTTDGGYIIAGWTSSYGADMANVYLVKTDASGDVMWQKTFGAEGDDYGRSVHQTTDGGYIIAGETNSFSDGNMDIYLIKTDAYGNKVWQKTFGGGDDEHGYSVQLTTDGGYIIAGNTESIRFSNDQSSVVYLIKTDANGNKEWENVFGIAGYSEGRSVQQTSDGGYIITGSTESYGPAHVIMYPDVYLIKTDAYGNTE